jgi:hypothetical protein
METQFSSTQTLFERNNNVSVMRRVLHQASHACHSANAENFKLKLIGKKPLVSYLDPIFGISFNTSLFVVQKEVQEFKYAIKY